MKRVSRILGALLLLSLAACGVETAGTAATAAAVKKQEIEQGKNTMRDAQEKIDAAAKKVEPRSSAVFGFLSLTLAFNVLGSMRKLTKAKPALPM